MKYINWTYDKSMSLAYGFKAQFNSRGMEKYSRSLNIQSQSQLYKIIARWYETPIQLSHFFFIFAILLEKRIRNVERPTGATYKKILNFFTFDCGC